MIDTEYFVITKKHKFSSYQLCLILGICIAVFLFITLSFIPHTFLKDSAYASINTYIAS